jgi:hypothetical protein
MTRKARGVVIQNRFECTLHQPEPVTNILRRRRHKFVETSTLRLKSLMANRATLGFLILLGRSLRDAGANKPTPAIGSVIEPILSD